MEIALDYVALTGEVDLRSKVRDLMYKLFGEERRETRPMFGYWEAESYGIEGVSCHWGRDDMGFHVRISGKGCEALRGHLADILTLGKASRLDIALDQVPMTPYQFLEKVKTGMCRNLSSRYSVIESNHGESPVTVYAGSRQSEKFVRCYSKETGTRLELEVKGSLAKSIQELLLKGVTLNQVMISVFKILDVKGTNSSRDVVVQWWKDIADAIPIVRSAVVRTWQKTRSWLISAISKSLVSVMEKDPAVLRTLIEKGHQKIYATTDRYRATLQPT